MGHLPVISNMRRIHLARIDGERGFEASRVMIPECTEKSLTNRLNEAGGTMWKWLLVRFWWLALPLVLFAGRALILNGW